MYQLDNFANGRFDVRAENGMRAGSIIGGAGNWCAEIGNRVVGYYPSTEAAAEAILKERGIVGLFEQMQAIISSSKRLHPAFCDDFEKFDRRIMKDWGGATSHLWIVREYGTHLVQLDLPTTQREGDAVLKAVHPDMTGRPWDLYLIDANALKVTPISEAHAQQLVSAPPKYRLDGMKITAMGKTLATINQSLALGFASFDRRCNISVECVEEPSRQVLEVMKTIAFYAGTPRANDGVYGAAASVEIFHNKTRLYHWSAGN